MPTHSGTLNIILLLYNFQFTRCTIHIDDAHEHESDRREIIFVYVLGSTTHRFELQFDAAERVTFFFLSLLLLFRLVNRQNGEIILEIIKYFTIDSLKRQYLIRDRVFMK